MARMTKQDWFDLASRQLVAFGEEGLTLGALSRAAGVTQGSYYHHFGSQERFVHAFLDYLRTRAFGHVSALADRDVSSPEEARRALEDLVDAIAAEDLGLEAAVRRWSHGNKQVAAAVSELDERRAELVHRLFLAVTHDPLAAAYLTRLNIAFYLGAVHSTPPIQGAEYARMAGDLERLLDGSGLGR